MSEFLVSLNPLNQEPVGQVPITSRSELTEIVGRSRIAQASAQNQLARLISLEMGKDARRWLQICSFAHYSTICPSI